MKKTIASSRWILSFFAMVLVLCTLLALGAWAVDPFLSTRPISWITTSPAGW